MIVECIKEGFSLAHRNWQLILLRLAVTIINFIAFFIFLGVPVFVAIAHLGMDITHAKDLIPHLVQDPLGFVSKYLRLGFLILTAFIFYLIFFSILFLYTLSGTLGVLKNSAVNIGYRFSLSSFFKEAKEHFSHLFWLINILLIGFTGLLVVLVISGGVGVSILQTLANTETSTGVFFTSFFVLSIVIFGIIVFLAAIIFIVFSVTTSVVEGEGAVDSIKRTFNFLKNKPKAFLFYIVLLAGIVVVNFALLIFEMPLNRIPVIIALINAAFQNYLAIIVWGSLVAFYVKGLNYTVYQDSYDI